jgi:hypothetical protein
MNDHAFVFFLAFASLVPATGLLRAQPAAGQPGMRWIGQDGHDYVGPNNRLEPSEVQDIHLVITGLDPGREIVFVDVTSTEHDQWQYNAQSFSWKAELKRAKGSRTADLFIEPGHVEAPRAYHVLYREDQGQTREFDIRGRKVSRSLRMPGAVLGAKWLGQDRHDRVGGGPSVGPDGIQDARIRLFGVSTKVAVKAIRIDGPAGAKWESGANPELLPNAEFVADAKKPGEGDLFFQPETDVKGQKLRIALLYENETRDATAVLAGRCDAKLRIPSLPLPRFTEAAVTARWLGQDGTDATGPGDVHVRLTFHGRIPSIAGAALTNSVRGTWVHRGSDRVKLFVPEGDPTGPLVVRPGTEPQALDLVFPPCRDETQATMTLRLVEPDGRATVAWFPGGACDPGRRAPGPAATQVEARPGDDLNALAARAGTVQLAPGTYRLSRPLVLDNPVTIAGDGKATLMFSQAAGEAPWTTAIKIHSGHTTLRGFAVRFEGPIRWNREVSYGAAVIGTTDNQDQGHDALKVGLTLTGLDLETPAATDPSKWVEDVRLMRFTNARAGVVSKNVLRGGPIEFFDGPWQFMENDFRGTPAGTFSYAVFAGHGTHDVVIRGNRTSQAPNSGKTWRFLTLTQRGSNDRIEDNVIEGIGSREDDTIPWSNAPEIMLTEAYHLTYEGTVAGLSHEGRLLRTHQPQGREAGTGDVVALLSGPAAGQFRMISQVLEPTAYVVDAPIPKGTEVVSIARGFVHETFRNNRIDLWAGKRSGGLILVGNHYGTKVVQNHILGGAHALILSACPTETPVFWGWSHAPCLGAVVEHNVFEDALLGAVLGVEHAPRQIKSSQGRVYMSLGLDRNTVRWTEPFLRRSTQDGGKSAAPPGLTLGYTPSHDAGEFVVKASGNRLDAPAGVRPAGSMIIHAAEYNGRKFLNRTFSLPAGPGDPRAAGPVLERSRR